MALYQSMVMHILLCGTVLCSPGLLAHSYGLKPVCAHEHTFVQYSSLQSEGMGAQLWPYTSLWSCAFFCAAQFFVVWGYMRIVMA
jgi:hypothetical protein